MLFDTIIGYDHIKSHLLTSVSRGRIPHAQLFVGAEGSGVLMMAIAYAQQILCGIKTEEGKEHQVACNMKFEHFAHPDLHFIFPTVTTDEVKSKPRSIDFLPLWREFLKEKPYGNLYEWYDKIGIGNKQGEIRVDDASEILKSLALKSYEGGYKIVIIWMADKMNVAASNKLLKLLEEPSDKTLFILITEKEEDLLQTIHSRCQVVHFPKLSEASITNHLIQYQGIEEKKAATIAHKSQGNYNKALQYCSNTNEDAPFETWFINWVRAAFRAKGNANAILDLISWSEEIAKLGRENQKKFLNFCIEMFRQALLQNYQAESMVFYESSVQGFELKKFSPFVSGNNINEIYNELNEAIYHIERNGNAKIILTDLSIKLTRLIHKK